MSDYVHSQFKIFANFVYPVQIITSEVTIIDDFGKKIIKINKKIQGKNHLQYTCFHFLFWSYAFILSLHLFTLLCFNIYMISD